jgi:hypothetical protein
MADGGALNLTMAETKGTGPSLPLVTLAFLLLFLALILAMIGGPQSNMMGFVVGSVFGTASLALFLVSDNKRRATRMYGDWTPSPRRYVPWLALISWAVGAWNIFFWALDWTRGA